MIIGTTLFEIGSLENGYVVENDCRANGAKTFFDTWTEVLEYLYIIGEIEGLYGDDEDVSSE